MKDKLLFVATQMEAGGVQIRSTSMQDALRNEGIDTDLVFLYKKRPVFSTNEHRFALLDHTPSGPLEYAGIFYKLFQRILNVRPTAVVGFAHYSSPISCLFAAVCGVKRRVATQTNPPSTMPKVARVLDWVCGITGIYTHNIAASHSVLRAFDNYPNAYKKRLSVVYNGINTATSSLTKRQAREEFKLPLDLPLLIACGRLSYQKNHKLLLHTIRELPECHLAILGDGELRRELEILSETLGVRERVTFLGEVEPSRVKHFLRAGDLFLFPSHYEAFGLAVAEAMMSGLPVISSDHPALKEVVAEAGLLLPVDDPTVWVQTIKRVLGDEFLLRRMSEESRRQASKFTFKSMLEGFKSAAIPTPAPTKA